MAIFLFVKMGIFGYTHCTGAGILFSFWRVSLTGGAVSVRYAAYCRVSSDIVPYNRLYGIEFDG
jgi:hypothetical protein